MTEDEEIAAQEVRGIALLAAATRRSSLDLGAGGSLDIKATIRLARAYEDYIRTGGMPDDAPA